MKKLTMKLDDLQVDSFATAPQTSARRGTVRGHLTVNASFSHCYVISEGGGCDFQTLGCDQTMDCFESANCP